MPPSHKLDTEELHGILEHSLKTRQILDEHSFRRLLKKAEQLPDDIERLRYTALCYAASGNYKTANDLFSDAIRKYSSETIALTFLIYLAESGQHKLYRDYSVIYAEEIPTISIKMRGMHSAYAKGDPDLSLKFASQILSMMTEPSEKATFAHIVGKRTNQLRNFLKASQLNSEKMEELGLLVVKIANSFNVRAIDQEYYVESDTNTSVLICTVVCDDASLIADMDIALVTEISLNEKFSSDNLTAWYRGEKSDGGKL